MLPFQKETSPVDRTAELMGARAVSHAEEITQACAGVAQRFGLIAVLGVGGVVGCAAPSETGFTLGNAPHCQSLEVVPEPSTCLSDVDYDEYEALFWDALEPEGEQEVHFSLDNGMTRLENGCEWWSDLLIEDLACAAMNFSLATGIPPEDVAEAIDEAQDGISTWGYLNDESTHSIGGLNGGDIVIVTGPASEIAPAVFHELWHGVLDRAFGPTIHNVALVEGGVELSTAMAFPMDEDHLAYPTYMLLTASLDPDIPAMSFENPRFYYALIQDAQLSRPYDDTLLNQLLDTFAVAYGLDSTEDWVDLHELYTINYLTDELGQPWDDHIKWVFFRDLMERNGYDWDVFLKEMAPNEAVLHFWQQYSIDAERFPYY